MDSSASLFPSSSHTSLELLSQITNCCQFCGPSASSKNIEEGLMWVLGGGWRLPWTWTYCAGYCTCVVISTSLKSFFFPSQSEVRSLPDKFNNLSIGGRSQSEVLAFLNAYSLGVPLTLACHVGLGGPRSLGSFVSHEVSAPLLCCRYPHLFSLDLLNLPRAILRENSKKPTHLTPGYVSRNANPSGVLLFPFCITTNY